MPAPRPWAGYAGALAAVAACTAAGHAMTPRFDIVNVAMVYLLAVVIVALKATRSAAVLCAALSVAVFDFAFVPPQGAFTVNDVQYLLTFAILIAVALVISHLTESGRREAAESARQAMRAESEAIRSALLASISHDLRSPLAVLTGASSTLAERGERLAPAERAALAASLAAQARELSGHVDKVLQMTRLESGGVALDRDWACLDEIAGTVLARLSERLAAHRVLVEVPSDLPLVRVDAALVEQALANLLDNAARHTPPGTVVRLRAKSAGGEIVVSVEDTGPGLAEADRERLFAKFERGAAEGSGRGLGLGLSIVQAVVALHGGRAWTEPVAGGGIAFRFSLPVEPPPPPPADPEGPPA